jgi:hypothetical protein
VTVLLALAVAAGACDLQPRRSRKGRKATPAKADRSPAAPARGASLTYPPVVTDQDLKQRGDEMLAALVRSYQHGTEQHRKNFASACELINQAFQAKGVGLARVTCDVINHPAFNANTLPGGIIVATSSLVAAYTNLAAAQVLHKDRIQDYLAYNDALAKAIVAGTAPDQLPLPACPGGGGACLAELARNPLFIARVTGLLTSIAAHEYGHVRAGHVLAEFLRKNVEQFNTASFKELTGKQVDALYSTLQGAAMNQVDEYQADEEAAKYLVFCHAYTTEKYQTSLGDRLVGPHPMDAVYTLWFLMSVDDAARAAGKAEPAHQKNHPPAKLRAQRVLHVIIRNQLVSHEMAKAAYEKLFGKL